MPRLAHLTLDAQHSILSSFSDVVNDVSRLRSFVASVFSPLSSSSTPNKRSRTLEALAEATHHELTEFDRWAASKEEALLSARGGKGPSLTVSLLSLEREVKDVFGDAASILATTVEAFAAIVSTPGRHRTPPARTAARVLDALFNAAENCAVIGEQSAAKTLLRLFLKTAEPVWEMVGHWIIQGADATASDYGLQWGGLDEEFFIEDNGLPVWSPDFWSEGYKLRGDFSAPDEGYGEIEDGYIPAFLAPVADLIIGAGKAVGLLRALDRDDPIYDSSNADEWLSLATVVSSASLSATLSRAELLRFLTDHLTPRCLAAQSALTRDLGDAYNLWHHLSAIEDLYLMRRGDAMSRFLDNVLAKVGLDANSVTLLRADWVERWTHSSDGRIFTT